MIDWDMTSKAGTTIAAILIAIQIFVAVWSIYQTNKRDRMKSTLEYYEKVNQEIKTAKGDVRKKYGSTLTRDTCAQILKDSEYTVKLHKILNAYERMCLAANIGIFDIDVLNKISGANLIQNYDRYSAYILYRREIKDKEFIWVEFEKLIRELRRKRK
ncbi:DUF4760 domain-containing protein [Geomonas sp. Red32]|uniref:DUF4760 domain-containing protein n=1 Tax=Geomonas sp. Red32 TaxID=2912856 RepID=UPI00202CC001|nr:DUF4760 domain-containing protein [Geomonas sp. Red32]MCM0079999.1 DUF4760 domain-containing protein [Geomonas sp. Red32]